VDDEVMNMNVVASESVKHLLEKVRKDRKGELVFYIGEGCCDATAPYLYENYIVEPDAIRVGDAFGVPVFTSRRLAALRANETYRLDVISAARDSFSIESDYGVQLVLSPHPE
jgi:uncharacterized protein (DUF779 family)